MEQPQYNMFHRERFELEYRRLYTEIGLGSTIWSPLSSGLLTNKYANGIPEGSRVNQPELQWLRDFVASKEGQARIEKTKILAQLAGDLGTTVSKLALAWCLKNPNVSTVILGATQNTQLVDNLDALNVLPSLTEEVMLKIEEILGNKPKFPLYG
jgi:aryl-alcohol dehydrogenase-like predicted oxidoreductase